MSLTKRERRELAELEQMLDEEDPELVAQFGSCQQLLPPTPRAAHRVLRWFGSRHAG